VRIARASFPKGNRYTRLRDELSGDTTNWSFRILDAGMGLP